MKHFQKSKPELCSVQLWWPAYTCCTVSIKQIIQLEHYKCELKNIYVHPYTKSQPHCKNLNIFYVISTYPVNYTGWVNILEKKPKKQRKHILVHELTTLSDSKELGSRLFHGAKVIWILEMFIYDTEDLFSVQVIQ